MATATSRQCNILRRLGLQSRPNRAAMGDNQGIGCSSQQLPSWHHSLAQLRCCQRAWHALLKQLRDTEPFDDAAPHTIELELALLDALGRTAGLNMQTEPVRDVDHEARRTAIQETELAPKCRAGSCQGSHRV